MQGSVTVELPTKIGIYIDLQDSTIGDDQACKLMIDHLKKYYAADKEFPYFDIEIEEDASEQGIVMLTFDGDLEFEGTYSTPDDYIKYNSTLELEDVCDPDVTEDDFLASVRRAVAKGPFISFEFANNITTNTKDERFLKRAIDFTDDCEYPSDSDIAEALYDELDNITAGAIDYAYDAWRDREFDESKQLNESQKVKMTYPVMCDVGIDFYHGGYTFVRDENGNTPDGKNVADYILQMFRSNKLKVDGIEFDCNCDFSQDHFFLIFENPKVEYNYTYYPGSYDDPDDEEMEGYFAREDFDEFVDAVRDALKKMPFDVKFENGKSIKSEEFLNKHVFLNNYRCPTEDQFMTDVENKMNKDAEAEDDYLRSIGAFDFESVMKSVLDGKPLSEALLTEKEFWEEQPEEVYGDQAKEMEYQEAVNAWKNEIGPEIENLAKSARKINDLLAAGKQNYGIEPKGNLDATKFLSTMSMWTHFISSVLEG